MYIFWDWQHIIQLTPCLLILSPSLSVAIFTNMVLTLTPTWRSNHVPSKVWDEITYTFLNFNGATVEVKQWISNFIPHFIMDVITYPCCDLSWTMLVKGVPRLLPAGQVVWAAQME